MFREEVLERTQWNESVFHSYASSNLESSKEVVCLLLYKHSHSHLECLGLNKC